MPFVLNTHRISNHTISTRDDLVLALEDYLSHAPDAEVKKLVESLNEFWVSPEDVDEIGIALSCNIPQIFCTGDDFWFLCRGVLYMLDTVKLTATKRRHFIIDLEYFSKFLRTQSAWNCLIEQLSHLTTELVYKVADNVLVQMSSNLLVASVHNPMPLCGTENELNKKLLGKAPLKIDISDKVSLVAVGNKKQRELYIHVHDPEADRNAYNCYYAHSSMLAADVRLY